jgi:hypothetical protein
MQQFHLRVYCVASGALKVFMSSNILALFAGTAYDSPSCQTGGKPSDMDLSPHLTNTVLQDDVHESSVRLLKELVGCDVLSTAGIGTLLGPEDVRDIEDQVADILAETFKAALASAVHFQVEFWCFIDCRPSSSLFICRFCLMPLNCLGWTSW